MTEDKTKRARRAEPIDTRTARNGAVSYTFQLDIGTKPDGSRIRQRFTHDIKTEARCEYRRVSSEVAEGRCLPATMTTVAEFLGRCLAGRRDIRRVTVEGYRHALRPIMDRLGSLPLQQLTRAHVDELVTWRLAEGRGGNAPVSDMRTTVLAFVAQHPDGVRYAQVAEKSGTRAGRYPDRLREAGQLERPRRGVYTLAPGTVAPPAAHGVEARTVAAMLVVLSSALDDAAREGLATRNVARLVKRPDIEYTEMSVWTRAQAAAFRAHVGEHRLYALFLLALCGAAPLGSDGAALVPDRGQHAARAPGPRRHRRRRRGGRPEVAAQPSQPAAAR